MSIIPLPYDPLTLSLCDAAICGGGGKGWVGDDARGQNDAVGNLDC